MVVIFDEIDRCFKYKILFFTKTSTDKTYTTKYLSKTFVNFKQVIGFTETLGSSTIK